jgi:hypothetical protein
MKLIDPNELMELYTMEGELAAYADVLSVPIPVIRQNIKDMTIIEAEPVKHAKWYPESDEEMPCHMFKLVVCSACRKKANQLYIFCPNCGAKMDLDDNAI